MSNFKKYRNKITSEEIVGISRPATPKLQRPWKWRLSFSEHGIKRDRLFLSKNEFFKKYEEVTSDKS